MRVTNGFGTNYPSRHLQSRAKELPVTAQSPHVILVAPLLLEASEGLANLCGASIGGR